MPELTSIAVEYASAVAHPIRLRLVAALADGPRTPIGLASELDVPVPVAEHHLEELRQLGFAERQEHPDDTVTYELLMVPVLWDQAWGELPVASKRAAAAFTVTNLSARATAAVDRGGFDREDIHLTRTNLTVDEAGWRHLTKLFAQLFHELGELAEEPAPTGDTFRVTGALMLFTNEETQIDTRAARSQPIDEPHRVAEGLLDELDGAIVTDAPIDWKRVEELAERMRLLARGAQRAPSASVIPLRRDV